MMAGSLEVASPHGQEPEASHTASSVHTDQGTTANKRDMQAFEGATWPGGSAVRDGMSVWMQFNKRWCWWAGPRPSAWRVVAAVPHPPSQRWDLCGWARPRGTRRESCADAPSVQSSGLKPGNTTSVRRNHGTQQRNRLLSNIRMSTNNKMNGHFFVKYTMCLLSVNWMY